MAIIKHKSCKNVRYYDAVDYLTCKHKEDPDTGHYEPILDEYGLMIPRDNCAITYITAQGAEGDPEDWELACMRTNLTWQKNLAYDDVKIHEYIISHPEEDREKMTMEDLMNEGKAFVRECLPGYDALISVHRDTDNDHIHIAINSVRTIAREEQPWMEHNEDGIVCRKEIVAGGKHRDTAAFKHFRSDWVRDYTLSHHLSTLDINQAAADRKERKLSNRNTELRDKLITVAAQSKNFADFTNRMQQMYGIKVVRRGKTISVTPPDREKAIRLRALDLIPEDLYQLMPEEAPQYTPEAVVQREKVAAEKRADRKYAQWLDERCLANSDRADDLLADTARLVARKVEASGTPYKRADFAELHETLKQLVWLHRDLSTELDKVDALLTKWEECHNPVLPKATCDQARRYLIWAGLHPDRKECHAQLKLLRDTVAAQIDHVDELREVLTDTASEWKGTNMEHREAQSFEYLSRREMRLKGQLEDIRAKREKMGVIAYNIHNSTKRHFFGNKKRLAKAEHFYDLWDKYAAQEKEVEAKLHSTQRELKEIKARAAVKAKQDEPARPDD